MKFFYLILILCGLSAQNNNIKEEQLLFSKAMAMEQNNNTDNAINIYKSILRKDPFHQPSYFQLKNIFTNQNDYESAIDLINNWLVNNPHDLQSELALGAIYFQSQQKMLH